MALVYSTGRGRMCADCQRPVAECRCAAAEQAVVPNRIVATLRLETQKRGGKAVTVVAGLPRNAAFLKALCQDLKKACGAGGTAGDGVVEVQGDQRDRVRTHLRSVGVTVKG